MKKKVCFNQTKNGSVVMTLGHNSVVMTYLQLRKLEIHFSDIEGFDLKKYEEFYNINSSLY